MSANDTSLALGATPAARSAQLVVALAAAQHHEAELGKEVADRASTLLVHVLLAAMGGGFVDSDLVLLLAQRRRLTGVMVDLAADVVARIGGPDKFFALLDLSSTPTDWIGFTE